MRWQKQRFWHIHVGGIPRDWRLFSASRLTRQNCHSGQSSQHKPRGACNPTLRVGPDKVVHSIARIVCTVEHLWNCPCSHCSLPKSAASKDLQLLLSTLVLNTALRASSSVTSKGLQHFTAVSTTPTRILPHIPNCSDPLRRKGQ